MDAETFDSTVCDSDEAERILAESREIALAWSAYVPLEALLDLNIAAFWLYRSNGDGTVSMKWSIRKQVGHDISAPEALALQTEKFSHENFIRLVSGLDPHESLRIFRHPDGHWLTASEIISSDDGRA